MPEIIGKKISQLQTATTEEVTLDKVVPIPVGNKTKKVTLNQIKNLFGGGETPPASNPNIRRFIKDESLTESHIGLLAMQQVTILNDPPSGVEDFETKAVLCNTTPEILGIEGEYEIELKGIFEVSKSGVIENWDNWNFTYHLMYVGSAIFDFQYLFDATKGNNYGTDDGTGFLEFADNTEKQNALDWCISNSSADAMSDYFDILTPFYYDAISESFKAVVRQKSIPLFYAYFTDNSFNFGSSFNATAIVEYVKTIAEQVKSNILGTIVGIDDDEVLIDTSSVQTLKMASVADGAFATLPVPLGSEIGDLILLPWRNGTVIDLFGYSLATNYNPLLEENFFFVNGYFRPLTKAGAGENVIAQMM